MQNKSQGTIYPLSANLKKGDSDFLIGVPSQTSSPSNSNSGNTDDDRSKNQVYVLNQRLISNPNDIPLQQKDYSAAISVWQNALDKEPNGPNAERLKQLIPQTKEKLAAQQKTLIPM